MGGAFRLLRKSARKLIESEPANYKEIEDRVGADLAAIGLMPAPNHLDWLLYFLRVEAHAMEQARLQALEAAESEEAAIALMLFMMET